MKTEQHPTGRRLEVVGPQRHHVPARRNVRVELLTESLSRRLAHPTPHQNQATDQRDSH
ncbi:MAG: hypothetical protein R2743_19840 [Ilumatobacteraceae bacterium]